MVERLKGEKIKVFYTALDNLEAHFEKFLR